MRIAHVAGFFFAFNLMGLIIVIDKKTGINAVMERHEINCTFTLDKAENMLNEEKQDWLDDQKWHMNFQNTWRPALGWVCVMATAWNYVVAPAAIGVAELAGHPIYIKLVQEEILMELLATTLGIGGMRMIEKLKKVASG